MYQSCNRCVLFCASLLLICGSARADTLYVSNYTSGTITKVAADGTVTTFATGLDEAEGLGFNKAGTLYVVAHDPSIVEQVSPTGAVSTFDSSFMLGGGGLAVDQSGNVYVGDPFGDLYEYFPGLGRGNFATGLGAVQGLAFDTSGNLYAASRTTGNVYRISPTRNVGVFATGLGTPEGLAFDKNGNLFVSDGVSTISEVNSSGSVSLFATGLASPFGLAFDSSGNLYAAEAPEGRIGTTISKITPSGDVSTFATGLGEPTYLVAVAPEPASAGMLVLAACFILVCRFRPAGQPHNVEG